jgi:hypothetical protein
MRRFVIPHLIAVVIVFASHGLFGQVLPASVRVPDWKGRAILTDGVFTPGEWDDALAVQIRPGLHLLVKKSADFVFLGLKYSPSCRSIVDLFISPEGKDVTHLHVSAQLGERRLADRPSSGEGERFLWGDTRGWYANEVRWDEAKVEALMKAGTSRVEAVEAATYRYEGFEFQIRRSKFGSDEWLVRFESPMPPDWSDPVVFPDGTNRETTAGWLKLIMK